MKANISSIQHRQASDEKNADTQEKYRLTSALLEATSGLINTSDRHAVLQGFCECLVTASPHIRLAWIWVGDPAAREIIPQIYAGPAFEYAKNLRIRHTWLIQKGPVFQVLSGCTELASMGISPWSLYRPWRIAASRWDFQQAVVLRFSTTLPGQVGVLVLYVDDRKYFSEIGVDPILAMAHAVESILRQCDMVERLEGQIEIDPLTQIYNRRGWNSRLHQEMQKCQRSGTMLGIGILDLDNLKTINDHWGHGTGDYVLQEVVARIQDSLREGDVVARLGGDEFGLLLTDLHGMDDLKLVIERMQASIRNPYLVDNESITTSVSLGFTIYPLDDEDQETVVRHADRALYRAKANGKDQMCFYVREDAEQSVAQVKAYSRALLALESEKQCILHYQPIVSCKEGEQGTIRGAEVLLRLDPGDGQELLTPVSFFDKLDHPRFARQISLVALEAAITQWEMWQRDELTLRISVNISAQYLLDKRFLTDLDAILERHLDFPPDQLEIEITESAPLRNLGLAAQVLMACKDRAIRVTLDDFGTGYASLAYIQHLPIDTIKIDQSFILGVMDNVKCRAIIRSIITGATELGMEIIAEGVETSMCAEYLQQIGCEFLQGYFVARPMPAEQFTQWATARAKKFGEVKHFL